MARLRLWRGQGTVDSILNLKNLQICEMRWHESMFRVQLKPLSFATREPNSSAHESDGAPQLKPTLKQLKSQKWYRMRKHRF